VYLLVAGGMYLLTQGIYNGYVQLPGVNAGNGKATLVGVGVKTNAAFTLLAVYTCGKAYPCRICGIRLLGTGVVARHPQLYFTTNRQALQAYLMQHRVCGTRLVIYPPVEQGCLATMDRQGRQAYPLLRIAGRRGRYVQLYLRLCFI